MIINKLRVNIFIPNSIKSEIERILSRIYSNKVIIMGDEINRELSMLKIIQKTIDKINQNKGELKLKGIISDLDKISKMSYENEKTDEVVRQLIEKSKPELQEIIMDDIALHDNHKSFINTFKELKNYISGMKQGTLTLDDQYLLKLLELLREDLVKQENLSIAIELLAKKMDDILKEIRKNQ